MRLYVLIHATFLFSICSVGQNSCTNVFSGQVIDAHDSTPLNKAYLTILETGKVVTTNTKGEFFITNLCRGTYDVEVYHIDCPKKKFKVKILGDTQKTIMLEHHLEALNEIIINGQSKVNTSETLLETTLSKDILERFNGKALGDALNHISGVSSLNTGNTIVKPLIQGLHSSRITMISNGVRMEDQEWGEEHAPNIDINAVSSLTVLKGAGALQYSGDAVGGIIISDTEKVPVKDSIYGKTFLTTMSNGLGTSLSSQLTKSYDNGFYGSVQGTLKQFGDFRAPNYNLTNTGISERNVSLTFGANYFRYGFEAYASIFNTNLGILRASHLGNAGDLFRAISSSQPLVIEDFRYRNKAPKQEVTHKLFTFKGFRKINAFGKLTATYNFQNNERLEFDIRRGNDNIPALDIQLKTHALMLDLKSNLFENITLKTGIVARFQDNVSDPNTGVRRLIPDYTKYHLGAYSVLDYDIQPNLTLEFGARIDYIFQNTFKFYKTSLWESRGYDSRFPDLVIDVLPNQLLTNSKLHFYNPSGVLGAKYIFNKNYNLFLHYAITSRAPNPSELFSEGLHHSLARIEIGDFTFNSENSHKISLTLQKQKSSFNFSLNPYINIINDFILIEPMGSENTTRGSFPVWEYRQTDAQLLGVDIDASYNIIHPITVNHQFSLVKGYDRILDEPLINIPATNTKTRVRYFNSKLHNLTLDIESEYTFRQNEYPNNNFDIFIPTTETIETVDVSTPPEAYHLIHFSSSITKKIASKTTLQVGLDISNIFNISYRNYLNRFRYYADDLGRNIILSLKINY